MANEYKLSYTAGQIDEKLGKVDTIETNLTTLEQTVSEHESNAVGKNVEGQSYTDVVIGYDPEVGDLVYASNNTVAGEGAEIFNDYSNNMAVGKFSHAEGENTQAAGLASHTEGGNTITAGGYTHAEGWSTKATMTAAHAEGQFSVAAWQAAHAEGYQTHAYGMASHAEGQVTTASGNNSHAEGNNTAASGNYSHAEGINTTASKQASHAEGNDTTASGEAAHAEGQLTTASAYYSHAEGYNTTASGESAHAEGYQTTATNDCSHTEGMRTHAYGRYSHAEGSETFASGEASHAEGDHTIATSDYSHTQGKYNIEDAENKYAHIVGNGTATTRSNAHTLDWDGNAWFAGDVYVGGSGQSDTTNVKKLVTEDVFTDVAYINIEDNEDVEVPEPNNNGTEVILNGSNKAGSTASFYAPTSAGLEYQVLHSDGDGGTPYWAYPTMPLAHVSGNSSSTISLTDGTITNVPLDNDFNTSASFFTGSARFSSETTGAIKVPMTGIYMINVSGYFSATKPSTAAYGKRDLFVYNGTTEIFDVSDMFYAPTNTNLTGTLKGSGMVLLNADDLIYMKARISGVTGSISPQNKSTYLELVYMGEAY